MNFCGLFAGTAAAVGWILQLDYSPAEGGPGEAAAAARSSLCQVTHCTCHCIFSPCPPLQAHAHLSSRSGFPWTPPVNSCPARGAVMERTPCATHPRTCTCTGSCACAWHPKSCRLLLPIPPAPLGLPGRAGVNTLQDVGSKGEGGGSCFLHRWF